MMILFLTNSIILYAAPKPAEIINMPPTIDLSARPKGRPVDIVILTDYTGTKLVALQNQINLLKAKFENVNVDPVFHVVNDMKKVGVQTDSMYKWYRYGGVRVRWGQWASNNGNYKSPYTETHEILWEEAEALESKVSTLPKRKPTNVSYTKGSTKETETSFSWRQYFDVTVYCSNDIKTRGETSVTIQYVNFNNGSGFDKQGLERITPFVNTDWTKGEKLYDLQYDIMSLDFDKLNTISLRDSSDRYMMFISDGAVKDYSQQSGSYFSFGDLTEQVSQYIKNNKFTAIGVVPDEIKDMWMLSDKVTEIQPFINYTNFKLIDGSWKRIGGYIYNSLPSGTIAYPEPATNVDNIKNIKKTAGDFVLFKNGSLKVYDQESDNFINITNPPTGISFNNVTDIYDNGNIIYIELDSGEVYIYYPWDDFNKFKKLSYLDGYKKYFGLWSYTYLIDKAGSLYNIQFDGESVYDYYGDYQGTKYTVKVKRVIQKRRTNSNWDEIISGYIPSIADIQGNYVLFNNGDLVYTYLNDDYDGTFYMQDWKDNYWNNQCRLIDTDVKEIYLSDELVYYKKEGETTYKYAGWYKYSYNCRENRDGDWVCSTGYAYKQPTDSGMKSVTYLPLTRDILSADLNNNLYMLIGLDMTGVVVPKYHKIGTFEVDSVFNISSQYYDRYNALIKTKQGELYVFNYKKLIYDTGAYYYQFYGMKKSPKNIRYVKTSPDKKTIYVALEDGTVRGYGATFTGQLGIKYDSNFSNVEDRDPFVNNFALTDKTKKYITLNTLFRENLENKFYSVGQYTKALDDIYKKYENTSGSGNMYILLGDEIEYLPGTYKDRENDPEYSRKWIISHDPNHFDNSMGLSIYHNPTGTNTNPPTKLDKVGKYVINLKARDNPKNNNLFDNYRLWSTGDQNLTLYVHRKPIPLMNITVTQNSDETWRIIAADGGSYDLDHTSLANKGIVSWEWAWRDQWEDSWHYERMNRLDATGDRAYIISLRVKDMEGVWSDWIYQTIDNRQPPIAKFDIMKNPITSIELAQIKDTSYAIMSNLTNWHWIVKRINDNGTIGATLQDAKFPNSNADTGGYDTNVNLTKANPGVGKYRIYLRVKADNGLWSDGGTDATANINKMFYRDLTINQALKIDDVSIAGRWNHFRGWTDKFGKYKDVMKDVTYKDEKGVNQYPYRFLSYEKVDIGIKLEGYADKVIIDFPDGLDRMNYRDKLGYDYSYKEDVGYTVNFPLEVPVNPTLKDPVITWEYILPLVDSTATWENVRVKQPYTINIKAIKGSYEVTQTKKIDITGNVDDLIFIQPVER